MTYGANTLSPPSLQSQTSKSTLIITVWYEIEAESHFNLSVFFILLHALAFGFSSLHGYSLSLL